MRSAEKALGPVVGATGPKQSMFALSISKIPQENNNLLLAAPTYLHRGLTPVICPLRRSTENMEPAGARPDEL